MWHRILTYIGPEHARHMLLNASVTHVIFHLLLELPLRLSVWSILFVAWLIVLSAIRDDAQLPCFSAFSPSEINTLELLDCIKTNKASMDNIQADIIHQILHRFTLIGQKRLKLYLIFYFSDSFQNTHLEKSGKGQKYQTATKFFWFLCSKELLCMLLNVSFISAIIWLTCYIISSMCPLFVHASWNVLVERWPNTWTIHRHRQAERESPWPCVTDSFLAAHDQLHCFIHVIMVNVNYDGLSKKIKHNQQPVETMTAMATTAPRIHDMIDWIGKN